MLDNDFRNFDLTSFKKAQSEIIAKNDQAFLDQWASRTNYLRTKKYTPKQIQDIIEGSDLEAKIELSQSFFSRDGIYKKIILHYATLFKYAGVLIPNPSFGKDLSNTSIAKRYHKALSFIDQASLQNLCFNFAFRVLRDGSYYGLLLEATENSLVILDLPVKYCRSNYKDRNGNDVIEFNLAYFNSIIGEDQKKKALDAYPKMFRKAYKRWSNSSDTNGWITIPSSIGVCFCSYGDETAPMFLNTIPRCIDYEEAIETEKERELEEIRKIIVQKIPHLNEGELLFEPEEAAEIHAGTVEMMKNNDNVSVLTTYADVDSIISKTSADNRADNLKSMIDLPFVESGLSRELFSPTTSSGVPTSLKTHISLMSPLVNKFSNFFTSILNFLFANNTVNFKYIILPVTYFNEDDYIKLNLSLANSGFSFIVPAVASGLSQRDIVNLKDLEIKVLKLNEKLIPLQTSYTQSGNPADDSKAGAPTKKVEEKEEKTVKEIDAGTKGGSIDE